MGHNTVLAAGHPPGPAAVAKRRDGRPGADTAAGHEQVGAAVEATLSEFLAGEIATLAALDRELGGFARTARDAVLGGGKRIRPTFAYWGWRGVVGPRPPVAPILPALAALELLHAFALVHDDVMDASATRRGRPTTHRSLADEHVRAGRRGDPDRFGDAGAILIGDLCLVWADKLLSTAGVPERTLLAARRVYDQMRVEAIAGQYLDVLGEAAPHGWSLERAMRVVRHKTAAYTVLRPLRFGAALAGTVPGPRTGPETRAGSGQRLPVDVGTAYTGYGTAVGEAFQLRDDLLGVYGDPAVTGKPVGDDLRSGKPTTLLMIARELATSEQLNEFDRIYAEIERTVPDAPARLADLMKRIGAPARLEKMIGERATAAVEWTSLAPIHPAAREALAALALDVTRRHA